MILKKITDGGATVSEYPPPAPVSNYPVSTYHKNEATDQQIADAIELCKNSGFVIGARVKSRNSGFSTKQVIRSYWEPPKVTAYNTSKPSFYGGNENLKNLMVMRVVFEGTKSESPGCLYAISELELVDG